MILYQPPARRLVVDGRTVFQTPSKVDLSKLIACPTCHATVTQTCRSVNGNVTSEHGSRLVRRLCLCGVALGRSQRYCPPCSAYALQQGKNAHGRRRRAKVAA